MYHIANHNWIMFRQLPLRTEDKHNTRAKINKIFIFDISDNARIINGEYNIRTLYCARTQINISWLFFVIKDNAVILQRHIIYDAY